MSDFSKWFNNPLSEHMESDIVSRDFSQIEERVLAYYGDHELEYDELEDIMDMYAQL